MTVAKLNEWFLKTARNVKICDEKIENSKVKTERK